MMRFIIVMAFISVCFFSHGQKIKEVTVYGKDFEAAEIIDISAIESYMFGKDSIPITITGKIESTCQAKGCWMTLHLKNGETMRVTFKDYGFFVPTSGVEGRNTIVQGICMLQETSVAELQHYAKDAGKTKEQIAMISVPKTEYSFVATGVKILN